MADNTLVWEIERCRSADECIRFHPNSLKFFLTGYYGFIPLDDLITDMNQRDLPAGVRTEEHRDRSVFHGATELGITDLRIYGDTGLWKHGMYGMTEIRNYGV